MAGTRDRILVVETDPVISDLIGRQALTAAGFQVSIVGDAASAIPKAIQWTPDLILANLTLPGLSGKDLMVALASQGIETPVVIMAHKGAEADIVQTFRLGAADYLLLPVREAEVINVVERVLKRVYERRERDRLARQLQQTNQEMQQRVRELTTIFSIGKWMTSITDLSSLLEKIVDGAMRVTQGDLGWFLLRDEVNKPFILAAQANLPASMLDRLNQPWDDGVSSLVAMSGEALTLTGEPLKRFKIVSLGQSALIVPIAVQKKVIGLLVVMRRQPTPFSTSDQRLLEAMADYASVALVNSRLFKALEERARTLQATVENARLDEAVNGELIRVLKKELAGSAAASRAALETLAKDPTARWRSDQRPLLATIQEQIETLTLISELASPLVSLPAGQPLPLVNLNDLTAQAAKRCQVLLKAANVTLSMRLPPTAIPVRADPAQMAQVLDGLFSNAIKFTNNGGGIDVQLGVSADQQAHLVISNTGAEIDPALASRIFEEGYQPEQKATRFGGLGIRLSLVRQLIAHQEGKVWLESKPGKGVSFHVTLPLAQKRPSR
ncbi:MAG TPA: ATP-binding protein [Anaerolineaceae bacterium]